MISDSRPSVAVIGSGISGLTAAYLLQKTHRVSLFEADQRLGGHAHTHLVRTLAGNEIPVDSGFIVCNHRTYPNLMRLFAELNVKTRPTEMSMGITCDGCGLSYAGGRGIRSVLAQPRRITSPRFVRMLTEVPRFHRRARALLRSESNAGSDPTWGEFLAQGGFSKYFTQHFAVPLVSCVWSAGEPDARSYPARHLFQFLDHHGMLTITGSPTWQTVVGGSATYVERLAARLPDAHSDTPVRGVTRHLDQVEIRTADGQIAMFDRTVVAVHADQALALLTDATRPERDDLAAVGYSTNRTWLHRDGSVLPANPRARASWNYRMRSCAHGSSAVLVSYWMNRLHGYEDSEDLVVTLNPDDRVDPTSVIAEMSYTHPVFTREAVLAAARLRGAGGPRLAFAGAHLGWGFHEDGCRSGVQAAESFGGTW
jgi:predicted NAD/FAD-binding protein